MMRLDITTASRTFKPQWELPRWRGLKNLMKRKNAAMYRELLSDMDGIEFLWEKPCVRNNFWFYTIKVSKKRRKGLMDFLLSKKIQIRPVWKLIHTLPMYNDSEVFDI